MKFWTTEAPVPTRISLISRRTWNDGHGEVCRVVIEDGTARVWVADRNTVLLIDEAEVTGIARVGTGWSVTTPDGVWDVAPGGCGCGSPLKNWDPKGADVAG